MIVDITVDDEDLSMLVTHSRVMRMVLLQDAAFQCEKKEHDDKKLL